MCPSPYCASAGQALLVVARRDLSTNAGVEPRDRCLGGALLAQVIRADVDPTSRRTVRATIGVLRKQLIRQDLCSFLAPCGRLQQRRCRRRLAAACGCLAASPFRMPVCSRCVRPRLWVAVMRAVFSATGSVKRVRPAARHGRLVAAAMTLKHHAPGVAAPRGPSCTVSGVRTGYCRRSVHPATPCNSSG